MNSSSVTKSGASKEATDVSPEESGWTAYFEDFSNNYNREEDSLCSSFIDSPSLVSDAGSASAWKISHNKNVPACTSIGCSPKIPRKLIFKKTRSNKKLSLDDSLEDTASSPVNSPKVSELEQLDLYQKKPEAHITNTVVNLDFIVIGKEPISDDYKHLQADNNRSKVDFDYGKSDPCANLRSRGLCLVPLSMLVNYLG
ncbi:hypothetical protein CFOL_v3_20283 [Cephalotus follicularis]|uniref:Uncharacterized protein n=1 Tax=Cephalotus follicularis TaxID=3775 RepID=A0A1Q3C993_CEPFO|nr:hypothetical protein CFOL_v3_20283 [Cephalotus follicularis]